MIARRMQSTISSRGVIAIVCVMITATASEAENGAIEHGINHLEDIEEDLRVLENERTTNETIIDFLSSRNIESNGKTENVSVESKDIIFTSAIVSNGTDSEQVDELQRDQSDVRGDPPGHDDPRTDVQRTVNDLKSDRKVSPDQENTTTRDLTLTTVPVSRIESTVRSIIEDQDITSSNNVESLEEIESPIDHRVSSIEKSIVNSSESTTASVATSTLILERNEPKDIEDIRAISFQVPRKESEEQKKQQQLLRRGNVEHKSKDDGGNVEKTRKEHSRTLNNLLQGKSTKAFYEIKPSIRTEVERDEQTGLATTAKVFTGRKFILPSVDSAFGKFGPYFEDGDQEMNITARIGSNVLLDCKIGMLGDKQVTWLQHNKDSFRLLTVGRTQYSLDQRISLNFRYPSNWRLQILYVSPKDSGLYKCQVATHPPLVKKINVIVTAPSLTITDDSGRIVPKERHLKAGSALRLRCEARDVLESLNESVVWTRGDETLTEDVSENRTTEISEGKELLVIVSTLVVERASPRHAGNYSCLVPGKAGTSVAVHVLNGELPAAVHDGSGVSRAVLNLWLIHLAVSYVFSR